MEKLNGSFESKESYFSQAVDFLTQYSWLHRSANTEIIAQGLLDHIPLSWAQFVNLSQFDEVQKAVLGKCDETRLSEDIQRFTRSCWLLALQTKVYPEKDSVIRKKVNPKKGHEVEHFANMIGNGCRLKEIEHVVDIGSGLGYLDNELSEKYDMRVLGLERDPYRVFAATNRASEIKTCKCQAVYKVLDVRDDKPLKTSVETVLSEWFQELNVENRQPTLCMIGLHSCGDLSIAMMRLFIDSQRFHNMFLVSCCYHRMEWSMEHFDNNNFPLSDAFKSQCHAGSDPFHHSSCLPFLLRLAAQETPKQWLAQSASSRKRQVAHTFFRALLQAYANREGISLIKKHRKAVKKEVQRDDFQHYIEQAIVGYGLTDRADEHRLKLNEFYSEHAHLGQKVETFVILQVLLQPVAEALVLIDRVEFMNEKEGITASLEQVFNDALSPRCFALIAEK